METGIQLAMAARLQLRQVCSLPTLIVRHMSVVHLSNTVLNPPCLSSTSVQDSASQGMLITEGVSQMGHLHVVLVGYDSVSICVCASALFTDEMSSSSSKVELLLPNVVESPSLDNDRGDGLVLTVGARSELGTPAVDAEFTYVVLIHNDIRGGLASCGQNRYGGGALRHP